VSKKKPGSNRAKGVGGRKTKGSKGKPDARQVQVASARELGIQAKALGIRDGAKTHKGRKILERRAAKVVENPKRSIIIKGRKGSDTLNTLMRELHIMRGSGMSQLLWRKPHDIAPMEDASLIENQAVKYDCSLFALGSHQKKRPDNVVIGRVFDGHVLDMFEFGIENFKGTADFDATKHISADLKPILIFQGE
jgi:ribosome production factor 2